MENVRSVCYIGFDKNKFIKEINEAANILGIELTYNTKTKCYSNKKEAVLDYIKTYYDCFDIETFIDYVDCDRWFEDKMEGITAHAFPNGLVVLFDSLHYWNVVKK